MSKLNYWNKITSLPKGVIKEHGRMTGEYTLRISYSDGIWFLEYIYAGASLSEEEPCYPMSFSGDSLGEVVDKALDFFDANYGRYKLIG